LSSLSDSTLASRFDGAFGVGDATVEDTKPSDKMTGDGFTLATGEGSAVGSIVKGALSVLTGLA